MKKVFILTLVLLLWGCGSKYVSTLPPSDIEEPDRDLFERAMRDMYRNRFTVARLTLQTLINTYPDSEFLPQAKYALAESFYREGTRSSLNQAETEFKDYITFFPTSDLADDAQLMVAMTHVRQMEKPDRDSSQALLAELELKRMIETYPDSPLLDEAKQKLREVQEVLAEGVFGIGNHYFLRRAYAASTSRYKEILEKYPDYSRMPEALFTLAESLRRSNNEPEAGIYYGKILSEHPRSARAPDAKRWLTALNLPIPEANPVALARAQQNSREGKGLLSKVFGMFSRRPDVTTETDAASIQDEVQGTENEKGSGSFRIDPEVVQPEKKPQ